MVDVEVLTIYTLGYWPFIFPARIICGSLV